MNKYLIDMLKKGRNETGYTQAQVAKMLGIKGNTLSGYETGASEPDIDTYLQLCKIYNLDYVSILEKAYNLKPIDEIALSAEEQDHIKKFRSLDDYGKDMVDTVLQKEYERNIRYKKEFIQIDSPLLLPYYGRIVSAGTGQYVFDDIPPEMIEVESNHITMQADFAVGVNGDSMEPTYKDRDVLLIKKQPSVNIGEIGIFMINGEAFVKEFAGEFLKSHNDKYEDILVTDQTICLGKVVGKHI